MGNLISELREPRPGGQGCIPWLGETLIKERIIRLCAKGKIAINLRGMEYLQLKDGEIEDDAWKRMRGKLGTGKHLNETSILLPQAVPAVGGVTLTDNGKQPDPGPGAQPTPGGGSIIGGPSVGESGGGQEITGGIFGGGSGTSIYTPLNVPKTSALNLLGKLETWGIQPATQLQSLRLQIDNLTGAQLQDLIKKLPDGMTYALDLEMEDN